MVIIFLSFAAWRQRVSLQKQILIKVYLKIEYRNFYKVL